MDNQEQQSPQVQIYKNYANWMDKFPWYNTTIWFQLSGQNFEYFSN